MSIEEFHRYGLMLSEGFLDSETDRHDVKNLLGFHWRGTALPQKKIHKAKEALTSKLFCRIGFLAFPPIEIFVHHIGRDPFALTNMVAERGLTAKHLQLVKVRMNAGPMGIDVGDEPAIEV